VCCVMCLICYVISITLTLIATTQIQTVRYKSTGTHARARTHAHTL
jgi:hypothetical protein